LSGAPYLAFEVGFFALATLVLALTAPAWIAASFGLIAAADTAMLRVTTGSRRS
jgi:Flp pilus assembly protein TadB